MASRDDYRVGAVMGALVGDAAGATLEFYRRGPITREVAEAAMRMPGGGELGVGPGQITDDGELTLALASALAAGWPGFDLEAVARSFSDWYMSRPFDLGGTCRRAFGFVDATKGPVCVQMTSKACTFSEANGALMRATPVPAVFSHLPDERIAEMARAVAGLSHPNPACRDTAALYSVAIAYLIRTPGTVEARAAGAVGKLEAWPAEDLDPKVLAWMEDSRKPVDQLDDCTQHMGHVRHAFTLAVSLLRACAGYEEGIMTTLMCGGDTDTNAAIVGGLLGALHGVGGIPQPMLRPVLLFDPAAPYGPSNPIPRPAAYRAAGAIDINGVDR